MMGFMPTKRKEGLRSPISGCSEDRFREWWAFQKREEEFERRSEALAESGRHWQHAIRIVHRDMCKEEGTVWRWYGRKAGERDYAAEKAEKSRLAAERRESSMSRLPVSTINFIADNLTADTVADGNGVVRNGGKKLVGKSPSPAAMNLLEWARSSFENARDFWKQYNSRVMQRAASHDGEEAKRLAAVAGGKELPDVGACLDGVEVVKRLAKRAMLAARGVGPDGKPGELDIPDIDVDGLLKELGDASGDVEDVRGGPDILDEDVCVDGQSDTASAGSDAAVQSGVVSAVPGT